MTLGCGSDYRALVIFHCLEEDEKAAIFNLRVWLFNLFSVHVLLHLQHDLEPLIPNVLEKLTQQVCCATLVWLAGSLQV